MNENKIKRRCTQVRPGEHVELPGGIIVRNAGAYRIRLEIETPSHLLQSNPQETNSDEQTVK